MRQSLRVSSALRAPILALSAALAGWLGAPGAAVAQDYVPPGLAPGATYRLIFVTSETSGATSTSIADYNSFVTSDATLNPLLPTTTWSAVASTSGTNAIDNIACTPSCANDPIYLVSGQEVASSTANLFSGSILTAIEITESGLESQNGSYVWTGSTSAGVADTVLSCCDVFGPLGADNPTTGNAYATDPSWISGNLSLYADNPLYAISGELTAPAAVPEPGTISLFGFAVLAVGFLRRIGRRGPSAA